MNNSGNKPKSKTSNLLVNISFTLFLYRWLCTLLLQRGWRVEYSAASDSFTACPEGFKVRYWLAIQIFHRWQLIHRLPRRIQGMLLVGNPSIPPLATQSPPAQKDSRYAICWQSKYSGSGDSFTACLEGFKVGYWLAIQVFCC